MKKLKILLPSLFVICEVLGIICLIKYPHWLYINIFEICNRVIITYLIVKIAVRNAIKELMEEKKK